MNIEQIEAILQELQDQHVKVSLPIRGKIHLSYYGPLNITGNWNDNHSFILYTIHHWPDADISFRSSDVSKIIKTPTANLAASIILNIEENAGFKLSYEEI